MSTSKVTPIDRGKKAAKKVAEEAREVVGHTLEDVGERLGEASVEARRLAGEQAKHMKENYSRLHDTAEDVADEFDSYVINHPGRAVLVAVAVGFLIGVLLRDPDA